MFRGIFTSAAVVMLVLAAHSTAAGSAVSAPLVAAAVAPPLEPLVAALQALGLSGLAAFGSRRPAAARGACPSPAGPAPSATR